MNTAELTDTELRLQNALDRLLAGRPERTKADGRVSIKRINDESGLSRGAIYYYKEFVEMAKVKIAEYQEQKAKAASATEPAPVKISMTEKINHEKKLKDSYREQLVLERQANDLILQMNVRMAYRCLKLEAEVSTFHEKNVIKFPKR